MRMELDDTVEYIRNHAQFDEFCLLSDSTEKWTLDEGIFFLIRNIFTLKNKK